MMKKLSGHGVTCVEKTGEALVGFVNAADELCSAVISGSPGQMQMAFAVARAMDTLKKMGVLEDSK